MRRFLLVVLLAPGSAPVAAQEWNPEPVRELIRRAIEHRSAETLAGRAWYRARARGLVTFEVQVGPPEAAQTRLLKADELEVEVYWEGGERSKQLIRGWRDTTLLPTGLQYHRDHLGIVTDDFGPRIELGDGDEVRAVPHPLAPDGLDHYDYRARDSVLLSGPAGRLVLLAIDVRPRDPGQPRAVGTVHLDVARARLVRAELSFTRAAYLDRDLEAITVRLERALVDGAQWLPYRQEIVIRRRSAVLDFPLRSVIRGRWLIEEHERIDSIPLEVALSPPVGGLRAPGGRTAWSGDLLAAVDSAARAAPAFAGADARRQATALLQRRLLDGLPRVLPHLSSVSDLIRVNRVQGLAVGAGLTIRDVGGVALAARAAAGTADGRITGGLEVTVPVGPAGLSAGAERGVVDVSDVPVASGLVASLAAQEGGLDLGDYVLEEAVWLRWAVPLGRGVDARVEAAREWAWSVATEAGPAHGTYRPNAPLGGEPVWAGRIRLDYRRGDGGARPGAAQAALELSAGRTSSWGRALVQLRDGTGLGPGRLEGHLGIGLGTAGLPARRSFAIGGWGTLPGEPYRAWGGRRAAWGMLSWLGTVRGPAIPLGRYGKTSAVLHFGPFLAAGWADGPVTDAPWQPSRAIRPVAGVAIELLDRTIRVEIGQSWHGPLRPGVSIDVARAWWPVL